MRTLPAIVSSVAFLLAGPEVVLAQPKPAPAASAPGAGAELPPQEVEEDALKALKRMGAYLDTLKTFGLTANTTLEVVTVDGQRLQLDGVTTYKVRRPNGFVIDLKSDIKNRTFI